MRPVQNPHQEYTPREHIFGLNPSSLAPLPVINPRFHGLTIHDSCHPSSTVSPRLCLTCKTSTSSTPSQHQVFAIRYCLTYFDRKDSHAHYFPWEANMSALLGRLMAPPSPSTKPGNRHTPLRPASFARHERKTDPDPLMPPKRAHTFQNGTTMDSRTVSARAVLAESVPQSPDAFETTDNDEGEPGRASVDMRELPIELASLADRYNLQHSPAGPREARKR